MALMPPVFAPDTQLVAGARIEVVLEDGMGVGCIYVLRGLDAPPAELRLLRPAAVPALLELRDPGFVYFRRTDRTDALGRALYQQIVRD